jgi:hypothetical protein
MRENQQILINDNNIYLKLISLNGEKPSVKSLEGIGKDHKP